MEGFGIIPSKRPKSFDPRLASSFWGEKVGWDPSFTFIEVICFVIWWGGCSSFIVCHKQAGNVFNAPVSSVRDFLGCWVHQVHLHFTNPGALINSLAVST